MIHVVDDLRYRDHRGPDGHPERPERLAAVASALEGFERHLVRCTPRAAETEEIRLVHSAEHLAEVEAAVRQAPTRIDADTFVSPESLEVARLAVGATVDMALAVARGDTSHALAAVRPPGHHAEASQAMGFCLFNNVAIAARALQEQHGVGKLLILDWDVHHGNGTQHFFEDDPSVLYVSTHQYPYYPGTGDAAEAGRGAGLHTTLNIPMPAGCGDAEYVGALQRLLVPAAQAFEPEMILLSCGFDAHRDDPLASMDVSAEGYLAMTRIVRRLADDLCGGRLMCVLEGGYALSGLVEGTSALLAGLAEASGAELPQSVELDPGSMLRGVVDRVVAVHGDHFQGMGAQ